MKRFLGIDIGGTKCGVVVGDDVGTILGADHFATPATPRAALERLAASADRLVKTHGPIAATGISCGGPLDAARGLILSPPNLPGWDRVAVTAFFGERFNVPAFLQNDADAGALAEWHHGAGQGSTHMMFCTMGTGFGAGLVLDGRLYTGANGNAGEIGHVRLTDEGPVGFGKAGSVEGWCSGGGMTQLARMRLGQALSAKELAAAARDGDRAAAALFAEVGEKLGRALAIAIDLLNLDTIVLGSIFARAETLIRPAMQRGLEAECLPHSLAACTIKPAALGEKLGDVAALTVAHNGLLNHP